MHRRSLNLSCKIATADERYEHSCRRRCPPKPPICLVACICDAGSTMHWSLVDGWMRFRPICPNAALLLYSFIRKGSGVVLSD